jgi:hypothetical protein
VTADAHDIVYKCVVGSTEGIASKDTWSNSDGTSKALFPAIRAVALCGDVRVGSD